jgi:hypothetical protein
MNFKFKVDWCDHKAATYAVMKWHYSKSMPVGKLVKIGVWENNIFIGCVIFGRGATGNIGSPYGLKQIEICELVRVALKSDHKAPVSKIISISLNLLKNQCKGIRLVVSYADTSQGHHGGIYQASNWIYVGDKECDALRVYGRVIHRRSLYSKYGSSGLPWVKKNIDPNAQRFQNGMKHKYIYPLDKSMDVYVKPLAKPYPKREKQAMDGLPAITAAVQRRPSRSKEALFDARQEAVQG